MRALDGLGELDQVMALLPGGLDIIGISVYYQCHHDDDLGSSTYSRALAYFWQHGLMVS